MLGEKGGSDLEINVLKEVRNNDAYILLGNNIRQDALVGDYCEILNMYVAVCSQLRCKGDVVAVLEVVVDVVGTPRVEERVDEELTHDELAHLCLVLLHHGCIGAWSGWVESRIAFLH